MDFRERFQAYLLAKEASPKTVVNYLADLEHFARWFASANGQPLTLPDLTPTDLRDYKAYLRTVERRQPATINRRLSTLRRLWA
jgi:integrase/recombinase XerC